MKTARARAQPRIGSLIVLATICLGAGCRPSNPESGAPAPAPPTTVAVPVVAAPAPGELPAIDVIATDAPRGGSVRVAVWSEPDPGAQTLVGAGVRSLVLPQLFVARPDGRWIPMLAEPGSDITSPDAQSATVRIRPGSAWSDGTPVTADDLRRTADGRFVAGIDGPDPTGSLILRFTHPLPGWRRLWSGTDVVSPPREGVWGGPFAVGSRTPGLETALTPNPGWRGPRPPLDEVRLVLVPDQTTARQLLAAGSIDVAAPLADTQRSSKLAGLDGVRVASAEATGGWWTGLRISGAVPLDERRAIVASIDRGRFADVLLTEEASPLDSLLAPPGRAWAEQGWRGDPASLDALEPLKDTTVDLVAPVEEPLGFLLHRSVAKRARLVGGRVELRAADADLVAGWVSREEYEAALVTEYDGPVVCWTCRWGSLDAELAQRADRGDRAAAAELEAKAAAEAVTLPLWRPVAVTAWRPDRIAGVTANPFGLSAAWDAWRWSRP